MLPRTEVEAREASYDYKLLFNWCAVKYAFINPFYDEVLETNERRVLSDLLFGGPSSDHIMQLEQNWSLRVMNLIFQNNKLLLPHDASPHKLGQRNPRRALGLCVP